MDDARYAEAERAYAAKDYRVAARGFLSVAQSAVPNSGYGYHMGGNALMKLRRYGDAVTVYQHALGDHAYCKRGTLRANLGAAYAAIGSYAEAVEEYLKALDDPTYNARYKAQQGLGGAYYDMGSTEEAAKAYRQAALDDDNPDPGRALNNLGLCFMAMGRPGDAVETYRAALECEGFKGKGRASANLGIAYAALGMGDKAVQAFETAMDAYGHELSSSAAAAYKRAKEVAEGAGPAREVVEGWATGEMPAVTGEDAEGESSFFTLTEQEMREQDRKARKAEREVRRSEKGVWSSVLGGVAAALLLVGGLGGAWGFGLGYPSQSATVRGLMKSYGAGKDVASFWVAVPAGDIGKEMAVLPPSYRDYRIDAIERNALTSRAKVTLTLEKGAPLHYAITLSREGVGWKVSGIQNDWRSTGGGS